MQRENRGERFEPDAAGMMNAAPGNPAVLEAFPRTGGFAPLPFDRFAFR